MKIKASVKNSFNVNDIKVSTENTEKTISIPSKQNGYGSSVNGGELLFLALATCACNDLYREAEKRGMILDSVEVGVTGIFGAEGETASEINYKVNVIAKKHSETEIQDLIRYTDTVMEIQNTLRKGVDVALSSQT